MIEDLKNALKKAALTAGIQNPEVFLEHPDDISHGDFATNIALVSAKQLKTNPKQLAEKILAEFNKNLPEDVLNASVAGPGFINITLKNEHFSGHVKEILKKEDKFGMQKVGKGKKVLVEYSSPNIAKPFTVGHLRSTIIGDSIARILNFLGYKVIRDNHLGDWGTQFGKLLVAIEKWGDIKEIEKSKEPIKKLVELYVRFHSEVEKLGEEGGKALENEARAKFLALEEGKDKNIQRLWKKCIDLSKKEFNTIYAQLGVKFDTEIGESFYATPKMTNKVLTELKSKNLLRESEGAQVVFFEGEKYPPLIIQKSDGTTIYATRDLAADLSRKEKYGAGLKIVNEVGSEQTLYFRQLFETEKMLGWFAEGERVHVAHGLYRFKEGKMSTREGNVIWLEDLIIEAIDRASKINPESAHDVAMAAIKFNDLKRDSNQDIIFNWDEMMTMTGDSGPYLQYSCVRAEAVLAKAKSRKIKPNITDTNRPEGNQTLDVLERYLARFPHIVEFSGSQYKPNIIAGYLINLASSFNNFYAHTTIVDDQHEDEWREYKVAVTKAFAIVMRNGLNLLGIEVPEKM